MPLTAVAIMVLITYAAKKHNSAYKWRKKNDLWSKWKLIMTRLELQNSFLILIDSCLFWSVPIFLVFITQCVLISVDIYRILLR